MNHCLSIYEIQTCGIPKVEVLSDSCDPMDILDRPPPMPCGLWCSFNDPSVFQNSLQEILDNCSHRSGPTVTQQRDDQK